MPREQTGPRKPGVSSEQCAAYLIVRDNAVGLARNLEHGYVDGLNVVPDLIICFAEYARQQQPIRK